MGKKRIIKKSEEELLKEREVVDAGVKKEVKAKKTLAVRRAIFTCLQPITTR
jgi:hypothetical protein